MNGACSFRAPAGSYRTLAAVTVCVIAAGASVVAAPQDGTDPAAPQPSMVQPIVPGAGVAQPVASQPSGAHQRVKLFDFDERPLGNFEDTPMYWTRLTGEGLPAYSKGRFDETIGHDAAPSFLLTLRGGNIAYEYAHSDLTISPDTDYLVAGYAKAEGLKHARAMLACYLVDAAGERIPGSEAVSGPIWSATRGTGTARYAITPNTPRPRSGPPEAGGHAPQGADRAEEQPWQRVEIAIPGRFPQAAAMRLQLWVLQSYVYDEPTETAVDPIVREDVNARVWFDDITLERIPRLRLSLSNPGGLIKPGAQETLNLDIHNATLAELGAEVVMVDAADAECFRQAFDAEETDGHDLQVPVPPLPPGLYRVQARLFAGDQTLIQRSMRFAVVPELPERRDRYPDLGVDLGPWPSSDPTGAAELVVTLGCGAAKIGVPTVGMSPEGDESDLCHSIRQLTRLLAMHQVETTGVILPPDAGTSARPGSTWRMVTTDEHWHTRAGPMLAYFGGQIASWQLGQERVELREPGGWDDAMVHSVRRQLERYFGVPHVIVPRSVLDAPPTSLPAELTGTQEPSAVEAVAASTGSAGTTPPGYIASYFLPAELPARSLPWHLAFWFDPRVAGVLGSGGDLPVFSDRDQPHWLSLEVDRGARTRATDRFADLARRIVLAKAANPERLFVPAPFALNDEAGAPTWQPTADYIPVRTIFEHLCGYRATAALTLPDDSVAVVFSRGKQHVLVLWTWREDAADASVELCVGGAASAVDVCGVSRPLEQHGSFARLPLTPSPLIVRDVDAPLLLMQQSFQVEPAFIETHDPRPRPVLTLRNHHPEMLVGTIVLHAPESWEVVPNPVYLRLASGEAFSQKLDFTLPLRQMAGQRVLGVDVHVQLPDPVDLHFDVPLTIGLKNLVVKATPWWDGDALVVEQSLQNLAASLVSFTAFCQPPARARIERVFLDIAAGETRIQRYRLPDARNLAGSHLWFGIQEIDGRRRLDQLVVIPP